MSVRVYIHNFPSDSSYINRGLPSAGRGRARSEVVGIALLHTSPVIVLGMASPTHVHIPIRFLGGLGLRYTIWRN